MRKNSNFKNISYSNFEFISVFIILTFCTFLSNIPKSILNTCSTGSVIGTLLLCLVAFIIYKVLTKYIFNNEYDIFEIIKKTYPKTIQKIIAIIFYIYCIFFVYILISDIVYNLKVTTYTQSTLFSLSLYFIIAIVLFARQGFNSIFRISGYISGLIVIYIAFIAAFSLPFMSISNFFPIFGQGYKEIFFDNFKNISIFAPLFFTLFFGGTIKNNSIRSNNKNFNKTFTIFTISLLLVVIMFIGTMPTELLDNRFTLLFDVSRIVSFSTTTVKIAPLMIFMFSLITFIAASFVLLIGCMSLERLKLVKEYTKTIVISIIVIALLLLIPQSLIYYNIVQHIFSYVSIALCFGFPLLTIFFYSIKNKGKKKYMNVTEEKQTLKEVNYYGQY